MLQGLVKLASDRGTGPRLMLGQVGLRGAVAACPEQELPRGAWRRVSMSAGDLVPFVGVATRKVTEIQPCPE
jgi:hypothetical protein